MTGPARPLRSRPAYGGTAPAVACLLILAVTLTGCGRESAGGPDGAVESASEGAVVDDACRAGEPVPLTVTVERRMPHDPRSYTQGLVIVDGAIFESSGLYGESALRLVDADDGSTLHRVELSDEVFAEGLTAVRDGQLIQLTWKEHRALRWATEGFDGNTAPFGEFSYDGEGWGLTTLANGNLLMSDGSDVLVERDPSTFDPIELHRVSRHRGRADMLNELEFDGTWVWANRYQTNELVRIDPSCWTVTGVVDLGPLRDEADREASSRGSSIDVANGIAYESANGTYLVTGKLWPIAFWVSFSEQSR